MDQIAQDLARFKKPAAAFAGGIAAALVIATLPHVYLENIVGATGLSEIIPAAAPPLGNTARSLIAVAAGMISASALYLILNQRTNIYEGGSDMGLAIHNNLTTESMEVEGGGKSRFAVPKLNLSAKSLTRFLKKPKKSPGQVTGLKDLPDIRQEDRHPDAPARQPIFASTDLGLPLATKIRRFDQPVDEMDSTESEEKAAQPTMTPEPLVSGNEQQPQFEERPSRDPSDDISQPEGMVTPRADLSTLSLAELADRLEAGLKRLEALQTPERAAVPLAKAASVPDAEVRTSAPEVSEAPVPVNIPPLRSIEPVETDSQDNRQADMDAALKAALGALDRMTARR